MRFHEDRPEDMHVFIWAWLDILIEDVDPSLCQHNKNSHLITICHVHACNMEKTENSFGHKEYEGKHMLRQVFADKLTYVGIAKGRWSIISSSETYSFYVQNAGESTASSVGRRGIGATPSAGEVKVGILLAHWWWLNAGWAEKESKQPSVCFRLRWKSISILLQYKSWITMLSWYPITVHLSSQKSPLEHCPISFSDIRRHNALSSNNLHDVS